MTRVFNDRGREDAGFCGTAGNCVSRAIAIAAEHSSKNSIADNQPDTSDYLVSIPDIRHVLKGRLAQCDSIRAHTKGIASHLQDLEIIRDELTIICDQLNSQNTTSHADALGRVRERCVAYWTLVERLHLP